MRRFRSDIEIVRDVLRATSGGSTVTQLIRRANLNHVLIQRYLVRLERARLVRSHNSPHVYEMTPKGVRFLDRIDALTRV